MTYRRFEDVIAKMHEYLQELEDCHVITRDGRGRLPLDLPANEGIYVFYEDGKPMYVGRSDRLRARLLQHGQASGGSETAPFAFNIAKEQFRATRPDCDSIFRKVLAEDPEFDPLFCEAKRRVRRMEFAPWGFRTPLSRRSSRSTLI